MIKNNLLGQILISALVLFLLISSIQMFGWGLGIDKVEIDQENLVSLPTIPKGMQIGEDSSAGDSKQMLVKIGARPMFSVDRLPFVEEELTDAEKGEGEPPPVINELKAQLTGVVITPEASYAMILDSLTNQRDIYKVGMPLDGEQGGWTLNSIESRKVVFVSDENKTEELDLQVFSGSMKAGKSGKNRATPKNANRNSATRKDKKKNADDIRKKIAERRAQMRAEAAKKNK
ncbi:hypothetical protein MNBD_GAMMA01-2181 [hydrothermal vent metagenome]|uniref:Type II secretion system protein GspC N-terminal domain-containing protein n=1 Tax=hydrothermal vent metagenome TaxID=652676 RepID=A0A3B0V200_9ZZZZ